MNLKKSIIFSGLIHGLIFAAAFTTRTIVHTGEGEYLQLMDIVLEAAPSPKRKIRHNAEIPEKKPGITAKNDLNLTEPDNTADSKGRNSVDYSETGGSSEIRDYYSLVRARIIKHLKYPALSKLKNEEGKVKIVFSIDKFGKLLNVFIQEKCSFSSLNDEAVKTICRAAPFEPFPDSFKTDTLTLKIPLKYELR